MVELKSVSKAFKKKIVLNNIQYTLEEGIYGLLGPNGAGKTTLIRTIANLYDVQHGEILIDGVNIKKQNKLGSIGYLPQKFGVFTDLTVQEMMEYFANIKKIGWKERRKQIDECLKIVNLESEKKKKACHLSGGMIRRLGVAQALLGNPKLLLLDEPTAGLDPEERIRFKGIISRIRKGKTILISTHIVEDIEACCNHIIVMRDGTILKGGTGDEIRNFARNRICEMEKSSLNSLQVPYYVEREYEKNDHIFCRVIVSADTNIAKTEPTIEDGYMCLLKGDELCGREDKAD